MKKIFLVTGVFMVTAITATYAQYSMDDNSPKEEREINQDAVSKSMKSQFTTDFPNSSNISFERIKDLEKVDFNQDGSQKTAYYDLDNQLVGTTIHESFHDLPSVAQIKILDKYKDYTVKDVLEFKVNSNNESYYDNDTYRNLYDNSFDNSNNYFVELKSENNAIVLEVGLSGEVSYFTAIK
jgi:hypothetical protein